jgi:hypothetical protein
MKLDTPYRVTGIPHCSHVFGFACIEQHIRLTSAGWVQCPLSRANWCYICSADDCASHPPCLWAYYTEKTMLLYALDYATVRYFLYSEPEYDGLRLLETTNWYGVQRMNTAWMFRDRYRDKLQTPGFEKRLQELRVTCKETLEEPGFDPWDMAALGLEGCANPLAFTNWHADTETLFQAIVHAFYHRPRGNRIQLAFCQDVKSEACKGGDGIPCRDLVFTESMKAWSVVRAEDDEEDFTRFMLELSWSCCVVYKSEMSLDGNESNVSTRGDDGIRGDDRSGEDEHVEAEE